MDDHVSRILKMLEEGKISATEAQTLIAALQTEARASGASSASSARNESGAQASSPQAEAGKAKSFEFQWGQKRSLPTFDLSGLGKQISDAVRKIDPERMVREARAGMARGGKRFSAGFKGFTWFADFDDGRPENNLNYPVARGGESLDFDLPAGSTIQAENNWGSIAVFGGKEKVTLEYDKEAWASTEPEAQAVLEQIKVEAGMHAGESGSRLEIRVVAPEGWHQGTANLRLHVPESMVLKLATVFGEMRVENTSAPVEVHAISGIISLDNLKGDVHAEGISGEIRATNIGGALHIASKSGDIKAENLAKGGTIAGVSGDVRVSGVEGGRLEAKSVSGDVLVEKAGKSQPVDITAESVSGNLKLEDARGNITLKTVSGHVSGFGLDALTLQAQTVSGNVDAALEQPFAGTLSANTVSGDVSLVAPTTSNFRFTIATQSGKLDCAHDIHDGNRSETLWTGTVGTGAGNLTVQTRSGDVRLEKTA
jgi:DUF4097 and DUF4098 domain-containing protein YvlB